MKSISDDDCTISQSSTNGWILISVKRAVYSALFLGLGFYMGIVIARQTCIPGKVNLCASSGQQFCAADGRSYGKCGWENIAE